MENPDVGTPLFKLKKVESIKDSDSQRDSLKSSEINDSE